MYSIGEFSKITGLTVKTLRFYHEQNVLLPSYVDGQTGYRYYDHGQVESARIIAELRKVEFSLAEIAEILHDRDDEGDFLDVLDRQRSSIMAKAKHYRDIQLRLEQMISREREARATMQHATFEVEERVLPRILIAGIRMRGKYSDCGQAFSRIGRTLGRHLCGKPLLLHYDAEYKEHDADFEACIPIRKGTPVDGISIRELPEGRCVCLLHEGPYEELGRSYAKILKHTKEKGFEVEMPTREVYVKGPGMIFKGNPTKYLTEIQMLIKQP